MMTRTRPFLRAAPPVLAAAFILTVLLAGCGGDNPASSGGGGFSSGETAAALDSVADRALALRGVENVLFLVDVPSKNFTWTAARGLADPAAGDSMTADRPFRVASVSKIFTAALVLDLVEEGLFDLDDSLGALLDSSLFPSGTGPPNLHVRSGVKRGGAITVRELLSHRSGLRDYIFESPEGTGEPGSLIYAYVEDLVTTGGAGIASTQWTPEGLLDYYMTSDLPGAPLFDPDSGHHYSDTNYLLLGHAVETATGNDFAEELRSRILDPLGLADTYLEWYEPSRGEGPAHHFFDLRFIGGPNADVVALGINTSLDWAGGGLVSTAEDLAVFLRALLEGRFFDRSSTLAAMLGWTDAGGGCEYGLGIERCLVAGETVIGHGGFWGIDLVYVPEMDAVIVIALNQVAADTREVLEEILASLASAGL